MQQSLIDFDSLNILWQVGNASNLSDIENYKSLEPFSECVVEFLNDISKELLHNKTAKQYPDVITLAFWIRRANLEAMKKKFYIDKNAIIRLGRGVAFHIAPSNVPVNYAYSLMTGLLCGNINIVRIPSKAFTQVDIINQAILDTLKNHQKLAKYIYLVQYGHEEIINKAFSEIADVRIIWGGDRTIEELRKAPLKSRATEVTFADRYSLAVINSESYMQLEDKTRFANDFYNDTYLTDQNGCNSPRVVVWTGNQIEEAKSVFWDMLHKRVEQTYELQGVQAVNKLTSAYILAATYADVKKEKMVDNLIVRMHVSKLSAELMDLRDNSGYFFEYDCQSMNELYDICNDLKCQTVAYLGEKEQVISLVKSGIHGIDRIVPVGKTMDFDFLWDGYNLFERLTRVINIV